jgi:hypothetical protein
MNFTGWWSGGRKSPTACGNRRTALAFLPSLVVECLARERAHAKKKLTLTDLNRIRAVSDRDMERKTLLNLEAAMKHLLITTSLLMASVIASGTAADAKSYSGSTEYRGTIRRVASNANGTHTVTNTDASGASSSQVIAPKAPGIYVPDGNGGEKLYTPPPKSNILGSTTYKGVTTTVTDNGNGTHTVTKIFANGLQTTQVTGL